MTDRLPSERIERAILLIRGHKALLDSDLAELYSVEVKQLKRQVKRNQDRFPVDFMFELSKQEYDALRSQIGTLKRGQHSVVGRFETTKFLVRQIAVQAVCVECTKMVHRVPCVSGQART